MKGIDSAPPVAERCGHAQAGSPLVRCTRDRGHEGYHRGYGYVWCCPGQSEPAAYADRLTHDAGCERQIYEVCAADSAPPAVLPTESDAQSRPDALTAAIEEHLLPGCGDEHGESIGAYERVVMAGALLRDLRPAAPPAVLDHGGGPADMASSKLAQDRDDVRLARAVLSYFTARPDGKCAACEAPAPDTSRESVGATCYSDCPVPVAREIAERLGVWPIKPRSAAQAPAAEQGPPLSPSVAGPSLLDLAREFCRQIVARWNAAFRLARALLSSPAPTSQEIGARMRRFDAQWGLSSPAVPRGLTEEERREVELIRRTCTGLERKLLRIIDRLTAEAPRTEGDADGR